MRVHHGAEADVWARGILTDGTTVGHVTSRARSADDYRGLPAMAVGAADTVDVSVGDTLLGADRGRSCGH